MEILQAEGLRRVGHGHDPNIGLADRGLEVAVALPAGPH
jgi:hypothetical protein